MTAPMSTNKIYKTAMSYEVEICGIPMRYRFYTRLKSVVQMMFILIFIIIAGFQGKCQGFFSGYVISKAVQAKKFNEEFVVTEIPESVGAPEYRFTLSFDSNGLYDVVAYSKKGIVKDVGNFSKGNGLLSFVDSGNRFVKIEFVNGQPSKKTHYYDRKGKRIREERVYDSQVRLISEIEYSKNGKHQHSRIINHTELTEVQKNYYKNGIIRMETTYDSIQLPHSNRLVIQIKWYDKSGSIKSEYSRTLLDSNFYQKKTIVYDELGNVRYEVSKKITRRRVDKERYR